jgi:hypothetical protein
MASVSAFVAIGQSHPNDVGFAPSWTAELWEGDRATWVLRPVDPKKRLRRWKPDSPDAIFDSFLEVLASVYRGPLDDPKNPSGITLVVVPLEGSSLLRFTRRFKVLKSFDVHLGSITWSRTWSSWSSSWSTKSR